MHALIHPAAIGSNMMAWSRRLSLREKCISLLSGGPPIVSEAAKVCQEMFDACSEICDNFSTIYCTDIIQILSEKY